MIGMPGLPCRSGILLSGRQRRIGQRLLHRHIPTSSRIMMAEFRTCQAAIHTASSRAFAIPKDVSASNQDDDEFLHVITSETKDVISQFGENADL
jgi:hypothetical protein